MEWLNYHHLLYFWVVAREGSIAAATQKLNLTQPTISAQLRLLEESLGEKLFEKSGRKLALTEAGRIALRYADEIFALGRELRDTLRDRPAGKGVKVQVGIGEMFPKMLAYRVLRVAFAVGEGTEMICREASTETLITLLAQHEVDVVLTDAPSAGRTMRVYNHLLGESGISIFAAPALATGLRRKFPESLENAPMLLPSNTTQIRRALELYFDASGITPRRAGEFDDFALLMEFGKGGLGAFPGPTILEKEIEGEANVRVVGRLPEVKQRFYAVTAERRIKNPMVSAITSAARREGFGGGSSE